MNAGLAHLVGEQVAGSVGKTGGIGVALEGAEHVEVGVAARMVGQVGVFKEGFDGIEAEAVYAEVEPEADGSEHGGLHFGVAPVEVGLLFEEKVVVILVGGFVVAPAWPAKNGVPVVGWCAVFAVAPDVPIPFGVVAAATRFLKPSVLVGGVVEY